MEEIRDVLGERKKLLKNIAGARETFKALQKKEVKKVYRSQPQGVAVFKNKIHMEVWDFCMRVAGGRQGVNFEGWLKTHVEQNGEAPPGYLFENPRAVELDKDGDLPLKTYDSLVETKKVGKKETVLNCRICHNTGFAYLIKGVVLSQGQPQNLIRTECWCKR